MHIKLTFCLQLCLYDLPTSLIKLLFTMSKRKLSAPFTEQLARLWPMRQRQLMTLSSVRTVQSASAIHIDFHTNFQWYKTTLKGIFSRKYLWYKYDDINARMKIVRTLVRNLKSILDYLVYLNHPVITVENMFAPVMLYSSIKVSLNCWTSNISNFIRCWLICGMSIVDANCGTRQTLTINWNRLILLFRDLDTTFWLGLRPWTNDARWPKWPHYISLRGLLICCTPFFSNVSNAFVFMLFIFLCTFHISEYGQ